MSRANKIVEVALSHLGEKEIPGNKGWVNKKFEALMKVVGWYFRAPWCAFFARLVWKEAGQNIKLISGSTFQTINLATKAGNWHTQPKIGAVVVWASFVNGRRLTNGHIGIVVEVDGDRFTTVEGNTTDRGGREGETVAQRHHRSTPKEWRTNNGLRLMGFIYPEE